MRTRLWGALLALAFLPAAAAAAPNREAELATLDTTYEWTSDVGSGVVYTSDVATKVPPCSPIFSCDATLIRTTVPGDLTFSIAGEGIGGQDTMMDLDLHIFASDADGTQGDSFGESVTDQPNETVFIEDAEPGYYLVYVDWYLGVGTFDGKATLATPVIEEEIPEEEL